MKQERQHYCNNYKVYLSLDVFIIKVTATKRLQWSACIEGMEERRQSFTDTIAVY